MVEGNASITHDVLRAPALRARGTRDGRGHGRAAARRISFPLPRSLVLGSAPSAPRRQVTWLAFPVAAIACTVSALMTFSLPLTSIVPQLPRRVSVLPLPITETLRPLQSMVLV